MPASQTSASDSRAAFDLLARLVQKWIRKQGWPALRDIQNRAIPEILAGGDVIIAAATASGKTEAAFLPLVSRVLERPPAPGFRVVYLAPLKALINDQYLRLEQLCEDIRLPLHKWHGDVAQSSKQHARKNPAGILLITPESLEATFVNRGSEVAALFAGLEAVVIDELHAFIGAERGIQLTSLLARLENALGRPVDRIGLSATLGDMSLASQALRPADRDTVKQLEAATDGKSVDIECRVFEISPDDDPSEGTTHERKRKAQAAVDRAIAEELFERFRGKPHLIFANSRKDVETMSYLLRETSERKGVLNEFLPHHGKLSKELREFAEREIKARNRATTIVATSTLEMGVDIGSVEAVAQIAPPTSVAALRQRVGRSGRRAGQKPALRMYIRETAADGGANLLSQLHVKLVQGLAVSKLLQEGWCEPPNKAGLHLSTLVQQIMALIAQKSGCSPLGLYTSLCVDGPFRSITPEIFQVLIRSMAAPERALIEQASDGTLLLGRKGEKRVEHYSFYAVFQTPEEFRIVADNSVLGTLIPDPADLMIGAPIAMAGRRWEVCEVNIDAKALKVIPAVQGHAKSPGGPVDIHERIAQEMRAIYVEKNHFDYLDETGQRLLDNARFAFKTAALAASPIVPSSSGSDIFPWTGTRQLAGLALALGGLGCQAHVTFPIVHARATGYRELVQHLRTLAAQPAPDPAQLRHACDLKAAVMEKFDYAVPDELRAEAFLRDKVDLPSVPRIAAGLLEQHV